MRRAAKRDANHAEIVSALRKIGCGVIDLAAVGGGIPDLLVSEPTWPHKLHLLEVKDGEKPPSARKLTPDQERFHAKWKGEIHVVKSIDEALAAVLGNEDDNPTGITYYGGLGSGRIVKVRIANGNGE